MDKRPRTTEHAAASLAHFAASAVSAATIDDLLDRTLSALTELTGAVSATVVLREGGRETHRVQVGDGEATRELALEHRGEVFGALRWVPSPDSSEDAWSLDVLAAQTAAALVETRRRAGLERAVRSRDHALAMVAHDLRTPLSVVKLSAGHLREQLVEWSTSRLVDRILRATERAETLVRDLVDVSAIEAGRFNVETRAVDPTPLLLAAVDAQQAAIASASVILATDISPSLPRVDADEGRLLAVLENLIGNAIKFTAPGGTITIGASRQGPDVQIWVRDTGRGIRDEELPHLFDRFWQAQKSDRRGAGLGLSICKAIVEAHRGQIWAESTPEKGTRMTFTLPAVTDSSHSSTADVANILLVDDRRENLLALQAILDRSDYRLVTAQSGEEALRHALRDRFAVALIDIAMPGMDGLEVASLLSTLEQSKKTPIIFVTAFGDDPREVHRAYGAGGVDYLVKPLNAAIVRKKVAVFVELSRHASAGRVP